MTKGTPPNKIDLADKSVEEMAKELAAMGHKPISEAAAEIPLDAAEAPQTVGAPPTSEVKKPSEPAVFKPARAKVSLSKDEMQGWIRISSLEPGERALTEVEIRAAIEAQSISFGINEDVVRRLAEFSVYGDEILIAEGRPPVHGQDAVIEFRFQVDPKTHLGKEDEAGRVDYKELNLIQNIAANEIAAVKKPMTDGEAGVTVKGRAIAARTGKDAKIAVGKNVVLSDDGLEARSVIAGAIMLLGGKIVVSEIYRVPRSVGAATGNINFIGSVEIGDSVEDGFVVTATESITVGKTVGKATVEAGGDITIKGGVIGRQEGKIVCGGDFRAKFVQEATIEAKHDVIIAEAVLHSHIEAGGSVYVGADSKKGMIVGGQIRALKAVSCKILGSPMSTKTLVDVGTSPKLLAKQETLQSQIIKDRQNYDNIKKGLDALEGLREKLGGSLPPEKSHIVETLLIGAESFKTKLQDMAIELRDLYGQISVSLDSSVSVYDELYSGVKISIGKGVFFSTQTEKFVTLRQEDGEIRTHTYEGTFPGQKASAKTKTDGAVQSAKPAESAKSGQPSS